MSRFLKTVDIWALNDEQRAKLQPGQHVKAGPDGPPGRFWGQRERSTVVAWRSNSRGKGWGYHKALRQYALAGRTTT